MILSDTLYSARNNLYVEQTPKQVAVTLMKRGINGEKAGKSEIYDRLLEIFGKNHPEMPSGEVREHAIRAIRRWVKGIEYTGLDVGYDPAEVTPELRSYVARLSILKSAMFKGEKLTVREVNHSARILMEFQDPHGEKVDLVAQYAVLWELAEREATDKQTQDIEDLLAYAPWVNDEASQLYRVAKETGLIQTYPWLRLIAVLVTPDSPRDTHIPYVYTGVHAHLNLPYIWSYIRELPDKNSHRVLEITYRDEPVLEQAGEPTDAEYCKRYCNWREYIQLIQSGAPTERVTISINRDEQEQSND